MAIVNKTNDWFKLINPSQQEKSVVKDLKEKENDLRTGCIKMSDKKASFKCW